jgi:hypothetical protein
LTDASRTCDNNIPGATPSLQDREQDANQTSTYRMLADEPWHRQETTTTTNTQTDSKQAILTQSPQPEIGQPKLATTTNHLETPVGESRGKSSAQPATQPQKNLISDSISQRLSLRYLARRKSIIECAHARLKTSSLGPSLRVSGTRINARKQFTHLACLKVVRCWSWLLRER